MAKFRKKTSSCSPAPEVDRCRHMFEIHGYQLHEGLGVGESLQSAAFAVGGYEWIISYYPDGFCKQSSGYASVCLDLRSDPKGTNLRAFFRFGVVNPATGACVYTVYTARGTDIKLDPTIHDLDHSSWVIRRFIKMPNKYRTLDDRFTVVCDLSVVVGDRVSGPETTTTDTIEVPPSNLSENLGKLLDTKEGADVTFKVKGVAFHAHKAVLASRSPVFKAELYGLIGQRKTRRGHITIQDMEPCVFKALLHFIYTDALPAAASDDDCDLDDVGVVEHLLVAADRYAMDRMRLMCESLLCRRLDAENVAATFALADQHYCSKLKDACVSFMSSRKRIKDVIGTQGYEHLKKARPSIAINLLEESVKSSVRSGHR